MKLGIMQPYFFPYLGYFSLIEATDYWIVLDNVQYMKHGWINRNRILKPGLQDWQYINVPLVKHSVYTAIKDVQIKETFAWKKKILAQLEHYRKRAPYYEQTVKLIKECLSIESKDIVETNTIILSILCNYLDIEFNYDIFSRMSLKIPPVLSSDEWALHIAAALNADEYINAPGGGNLYSKDKFSQLGIQLLFIKNALKKYDQKNDNFIAGLSIIDVLMFNNKMETLQIIKEYDLSE